jgi:hypothetical protein
LWGGTKKKTDQVRPALISSLFAPLTDKTSRLSQYMTDNANDVGCIKLMTIVFYAGSPETMLEDLMLIPTLTLCLGLTLLSANLKFVLGHRTPFVWLHKPRMVKVKPKKKKKKKKKKTIVL